VDACELPKPSITISGQDQLNAGNLCGHNALDEERFTR
jgi:hypothetical protein